MTRSPQQELLQAIAGDQVHPKRLESRLIATTNVALVGVSDPNAIGRVINAEPEKQIGFLEPLLERLSTHALILPALRNRPEDLAGLVAQFSRGGGTGPAPGLHDALASLREHDWPNNVAELRDCIRATSELPADATADFSGIGLGPNALKGARQTAERAVLTRALRYHQRNVTRAARALGVSRMTFYRLMERCGLQS